MVFRCLSVKRQGRERGLGIKGLKKKNGREEKKQPKLIRHLIIISIYISRHQ